MRDRLIELIKKARIKEVYETSDGKHVTSINRTIVDRSEASILADYLLENGVIVPSVKVGDVLYLPTEFGEIIDYEVETILYGANNEVKKINCCHYYCDGSGYYTTFRIEDIKYRTLYRSKEEAEQALKGGVKE